MIDYSKCLRYEDALTDNEIFTYAKLIDQFEKGESDYSALKSDFLLQGVNLEAIPVDISNKMMTVNDAEDYKKRVSEQKYISDDISGYLLNAEDYKNVIFYMDYKAIEVLANHGIPEYQQKLIGILSTQLTHSSDSNDEISAKRAMWKRRIDELKQNIDSNKKVR